MACEAAFELLQKGNYQLVAPTHTIASRNDPAFSELFSGCKLAPSAYQEDMDFDQYKSDPLYDQISSDNKEYGERIEGQFLPYGPFEVFNLPVGAGQRVRVIAVNGYKGIGAEYPTREFYLQSSHNKCAPFSLGSLGLFYDHDETRRRNWTAVISLKGDLYLATYSAWSGPDDDSGEVNLVPIKDYKEQVDVFRSSTLFFPRGPKYK